MTKEEHEMLVRMDERLVRIDERICALAEGQKDQEGRIRILERWRNGVLGAVGASGTGYGILKYLLPCIWAVILGGAIATTPASAQVYKSEDEHVRVDSILANCPTAGSVEDALECLDQNIGGEGGGGGDQLGANADRGDIIVSGAGTVADLDELAVESELEAVLDLSDLQGSVTDSQVPNDITVTDNTVVVDSTLTECSTSTNMEEFVECIDAAVASGGGGGGSNTSLDAQSAGVDDIEYDATGDAWYQDLDGNGDYNAVAAAGTAYGTADRIVAGELYEIKVGDFDGDGDIDQHDIEAARDTCRQGYRDGLGCKLILPRGVIKIRTEDGLEFGDMALSGNNMYNGLILQGQGGGVYGTANGLSACGTVLQRDDGLTNKKGHILSIVGFSVVLKDFCVDMTSDDELNGARVGIRYQADNGSTGSNQTNNGFTQNVRVMSKSGVTADQVGMQFGCEDEGCNYASSSTTRRTGTATAADASGVTLTDSSADFCDISETPTCATQWQIEDFPPDRIYNITDGSFAYINDSLTGTGQTDVTMAPLRGGIDNQWEVGDDYVIYTANDRVDMYTVMNSEIRGGIATCVSSFSDQGVQNNFIKTEFGCEERGIRIEKGNIRTFHSAWLVPAAASGDYIGVEIWRGHGGYHSTDDYAEWISGSAVKTCDIRGENCGTTTNGGDKSIIFTNPWWRFACTGTCTQYIADVVTRGNFKITGGRIYGTDTNTSRTVNIEFEDDPNWDSPMVLDITGNVFDYRADFNDINWTLPADGDWHGQVDMQAHGNDGDEVMTQHLHNNDLDINSSNEIAIESKNFDLLNDTATTSKFIVEHDGVAYDDVGDFTVSVSDAGGSADTAKVQLMAQNVIFGSLTFETPFLEADSNLDQITLGGTFTDGWSTIKLVPATGDVLQFTSNDWEIQGQTIVRGKRTACHVIDFAGSTAITASDGVESIWRAPENVTISEVWCETDTGTVTSDLQVDDGTPADVAGTSLVCDTDGEEDNTGLTGSLSEGQTVDLVIDSVASNPTRLTWCFEYNTQ